MVCSLVTVLFCLLLSGCVASNAVLRHANDIEQTLYWVPEVHTVQREASGWRLSGDSTLRPLDAARPPAAPWQLCIPARAPTNVTITMTSLAAYHCAEPVSASATPATPGNALRIPYHSGPVSGSTAIAAGDYLAFRSSHPAAGMPPSRALFHVASPTPAWVDVVHFEGHTQAETIKQGNRLYLALMPVAVVIDIVSTPVILTRYALHVRRQNKTSP
ncbi:MAG: hypothetical protein KDH99_01855 [Alcanivoracaceae bacterium]|nr:hypothetical protein [Alcanivoracaceae bacterium]